MKFNTAITEARWDEDGSKWHITAVRTAPDGTKEEVRDTCDVFVCASGVLNNWKWPEIKGLDTFKGRVIHTADWDQDYTAEKWKGENVLVVGSGASSLQVVPNMQPHVDRMDVFIRTVRPLLIEVTNWVGFNQDSIADVDSRAFGLPPWRKDLKSPKSTRRKKRPSSATNRRS